MGQVLCDFEAPKSGLFLVMQARRVCVCVCVWQTESLVFSHNFSFIDRLETHQLIEAVCATLKDCGKTKLCDSPRWNTSV